MTPLLLALVLSGSIGERSLDIGIDVLPEAFSFAASRVGFKPTLHLSTCTQERCLWEIGYGVEVTADHRSDSLTVNRIEAKLRPQRPAAPAAMRQFEQACQTIVALVDREGNEAQRRETAKAIAASAGAQPSVQLELPERNVRFYGTRASSMTQDRQDIVLRCGATTNF